MVDQVVWAMSLPRLYDLYCASNRGSPGNYFEHPNVKQALLDGSPGLPEIERDLQEMDAVAWKEFKAKTAAYVTKTDKWGWPTQLFDRFNEAKGYGYLKRQGYTELHFIPEVPGKKTPDLAGKQDDSTVLLEVKTIHESDDTNDYLTNSDKYSVEKDFQKVEHYLTDTMKQKLNRTIEVASEQLHYANDDATRRIIFLVVRLDLKCATQSTKEDLDAYLKQKQVAGIEIVHCLANPFLLGG